VEPEHHCATTEPGRHRTVGLFRRDHGIGEVYRFLVTTREGITVKKVVFLLVLLLGLPLLARASAAAPCDPTGTWYGGSAWKYMATITPNNDGTYTLLFQAAYDNSAFGYTAWTGMSAELVRRSDRAFELRGIVMNVLPPSSDPNTPPTVEMDVLHSFMRLKDGCETIVHTIDMYGGFMPFTDDKVPFVTPLDVSYLPPGGVMLETYHRMKRLK